MKLRKNAKLLWKIGKLLLTDFTLKQKKLNNWFSKIIVLSCSLKILSTLDHEYRMTFKKKYDTLSRIKIKLSDGNFEIFWQTQEADVKSKYLIYIAIPLNHLLWGCELWAIMKDLTNKQYCFEKRFSHKMEWGDWYQDLE